MNNTESSQDNRKSMTTGQRLCKAREKLGLSHQEVAERLCLKISTVRDIEGDSMPEDLAFTFVRGYIRSYAKLVHLPEDEVLIESDKKLKTIMQVTPIQTFSLGKRRKKHDSWFMICTWIIVLIILGLTGIWWWQNYQEQNKAITTIADRSDI